MNIRRQWIPIWYFAIAACCLYPLKVNAELVEDGAQEYLDSNSASQLGEQPTEGQQLEDQEAITEPSNSEREARNSDNEPIADSSASILPKESQEEAEYLEPEVSFSEAIYPEMAEASSEWMRWGKWGLISLALCLTLTPIMARIIFTPSLSIPIMIGSYWSGASGAAPGQGIKAGTNGMRNAEVVMLILLFAGPFGVWYCLHHPLMAFASQADETYCCVETFLGEESIAKKAISPDGKWLAEISESARLIEKGDVKEEYKLSVMDLSTGRYVIWPDTAQKYRGVDLHFHLSLEGLKVNNGIYAITMNMSGQNQYEQIPLETNFLKPLNGHLDSGVLKSYEFEAVYTDLIVLRDWSGNEIEITPTIKNSLSYLSPNGCVLAVVNTAENQNYDGLWSQLLHLQILQWWEIEFWDIAGGIKLRRYYGYGINNQALSEVFRGQVNFLESSSDGKYWYMIKNDGFIHKFDLSKFKGGLDGLGLS